MSYYDIDCLRSTSLESRITSSPSISIGLYNKSCFVQNLHFTNIFIYAK